MHPDKKPQPVTLEKQCKTGTSCSTGSCGGAGMCPGVALFLSATLGLGVASYFSTSWLSWLVGAPLFVLLVSGYWRKLFFG